MQTDYTVCTNGIVNGCTGFLIISQSIEILLELRHGLCRSEHRVVMCVLLKLTLEMFKLHHSRHKM